jgi:diguanylate cyclase (GGDEF)-like protein
MLVRIVAILLILAGALFLLFSLRPIKRIVQTLPDGPLQSQWKILGILVVLFMGGYVAYGVEAWLYNPSHLVPSIFFSGGLFVLLVANLSEKTANDRRRIDTLTQESITDSLMGIFNRRHFERCFHEQVEQSNQIPERKFSLLLIDVDHFKKINDSYGHQRGDEILRSIAARILGVARKSDIVARFGGEEICIIAPHCDKDESIHLANRIQEAINKTPMPTSIPGQTPLNVHVSIGIDTWKPNQSTCQLLASADAALYRAKELGRNRIEHSDFLSETDSKIVQRGCL